MIVHGFELLQDRNIDELKNRAMLYRHVKTGAELLSLVNDDENKVFGITFRTPPEDSTGIAHILEHSVLCGSRKYPVKEPFVELLKGSLKTFLNAFTYPDKTCYPVASQNVQDFYNLIDVYLDAVLYPRITPHIFQQEGWHYDMNYPGEPMIYKGVVYNEMKGSYSSPESVLAERSQQSVFPDITYGLDSGGDPEVIPSLTYEQFKAFHERNYHPSNARIYFYGDDNPDTRLRLINEYLDAFEPMEVSSAIELQPPFDEPRRIESFFASGGDGDSGEGPGPKGMVTLNWLLPETTDPELNFALHILQYILLGMPGSPLRKALIDSGLGEDRAGVGLENELRQMYFSTGLKGVDVEQSDLVEQLINETLNTLVKEGIDPLTIEAAFNTIEFHLRESSGGGLPRGLTLMLRALTTWLYGGDPLALLAFEAPLSALKSRVASDPRFFESMIERFFLGNRHRATLVLKPDPRLAEKVEATERQRLAKIQGSMSTSELDAAFENARELRRLQVEPDPPEALATIPVLKLSDLEKTNKLIPRVILDRKGATVLYHDLSTNGIAYLDVGFNIHGLPQDYLPLVPLFGRALVEMGTEREDFVTLSQRISRQTGGIRPEVFASAVTGAQTSAAWLFLRGKAMADRSGELANILGDTLRTVLLNNRERFRQMVLEEKARQEHKLVPGGNRIVNTRLCAHFSEADWAVEQMSGVSYLLFLRELARRIDEDWPSVLDSLEDLRSMLVNRKAMILNVTLDSGSWPAFESQLTDFLDTLPESAVSHTRWNPQYPPPFEGMMIPAQVNYVGKGADLYELGYRFHGSALAITGYLRNSWLWERVRVQGGAYGASCLFNRHSGILTFLSYRDPNLAQTIEAYDRTADFLGGIDLDQKELTKAIIGAIGQIDTYMLPDAKGFTSMIRFLTCDTDERRQKMRDEVLGTTTADFKDFAEVLARFNEAALVKVLGSQSAIEEALAQRPGWLTTLRVL